MKLAKFNTFEESRAKMDYYNSLAKHSSCLGGFELTSIEKSVDESFHFFNFDHCIENGGLARESIATDEANLDIHEFANEQELISAGWLLAPPNEPGE